MGQRGTDLPHFSEVILMAATCDHCGFRTTEVKSGGAIAPMGRRIELRLTDAQDLSRDVLKVSLLFLVFTFPSLGRGCRCCSECTCAFSLCLSLCL
jgi:C4-type Zn-finger protein